jgi:hypothetical protein
MPFATKRAEAGGVDGARQLAAHAYGGWCLGSGLCIILPGHLIYNLYKLIQI